MKSSNVRIITANIAPGVSYQIGNDGEWFTMRSCLTPNCTFVRDQESTPIPIAKGDTWPGEFSNLLVTNNDPTRTEQVVIWVGVGDIPKLGTAGGNNSNGETTDLVGKVNVSVGAGVTMQVVSAKNTQRGIWIMVSGAGAARFASTSAFVSAGGTFLAANVLTFIPGSSDLWIANPNGGAVTVSITVAQGS